MQLSPGYEMLPVVLMMRWLLVLLLEVLMHQMEKGLKVLMHQMEKGLKVLTQQMEKGLKVLMQQMEKGARLVG